MPTVPSPVEAVIFDKDGTLLDFHKTWNPGIEQAIREASIGQDEMHLAANRLGFDLDTSTTNSGSVLIADSNDAILAAVDGLVDLEQFASIMFARASSDVAGNIGVADLLDSLQRLGIKIGLATNDYESVARTQINKLGWSDYFGSVVGCDSGFGAKPDESMILACCDQLDVSPAASIMIGDSGHDITAGHAAGLYTVLITNGDEPVSYADLVMEDVTGLLRALAL